MVSAGILLHRAAMAIWAVAMAAGLGQMSRPCGNGEKEAFPAKASQKWRMMTAFPTAVSCFSLSCFRFWLGKT